MFNNKYALGTAVFIMPHRRKENSLTRQHLDAAIDSINNQTDSNWKLVIIDDYSEENSVREYLKTIQDKLKEKIHLIFCNSHVGTGVARNLGIQYAYKIGAPFVLFNDADDVSHPKRLEYVRKAFCKHNDVNVVYSSFDVIDEHGKYVNYDDICASVREILDGHQSDIVEGNNAWIKISTQKNYTNLTSCTAVRVDLAVNEPFPNATVSEDAHTWLRYGAYPGRFVFVNDIKNMYRICSGTKSKSRHENNDFYEQKATVDSDGFEKAILIAIKNKMIDETTIDEIRLKFYVRLALSLINGDEYPLAKKYLHMAYNISKKSTYDTIYSLKADVQSKNKLIKSMKGLDLNEN